jgi:phage baseplate assembly protein W
MNGTNAKDGKPLSGIDHLRQSIRDILTTPVGSRVMRRTYGSEIFALIDAPMNRSTLMRIYAATEKALTLWEPRFIVQKVVAATAAPGAIELDITGKYLPEGRVITLNGIQVK